MSSEEKFFNSITNNSTMSPNKLLSNWSHTFVEVEMCIQSRPLVMRDFMYHCKFRKGIEGEEKLWESYCRKYTEK